MANPRRPARGVETVGPQVAGVVEAFEMVEEFLSQPASAATAGEGRSVFSAC